MSSLHPLFAAGTIRDLCGLTTYLRGSQYQSEGRVEVEADDDTHVRAVVRGSRPYSVELRADGGTPRWSCTCPAAEDGSFCKHCVALALELDPDRDHALWEDLEVPATPRSEGTDLAGHVAGLDHATLVDIVLEQVESDPRLRHRLEAEARSAAGEGLDVAGWRRRVAAAFAPYDDFVGYREAAGWAEEIYEVIDELSELCEAGFAAEVVDLVEHAHRQADASIQWVDDSDGWLTDISTRLADLHRRASSQAGLEPEELAGRLVELELTSELDGFHRAALDHAEVLGEEGLQAYRRLLQPRWEAVADHDPRAFSTERFRVREAMVGVATALGDADGLIEVFSGDLGLPGRYLEIAQVLADVGRLEEAEQWVRDGLAAHADRTWQLEPLRELLTKMLRDRGEAGAAVEVFWEAFRQTPSLAAYRRLVTEAGEASSAWVDRAVEALQDRLDAAASGQPAVATVLVEVLLYEGRSGEAWDVATTHAITGDRVWQTLALAVEDTQPLDAAEVYERLAFNAIEQKNNRGYQTAVDLLARIRRLVDRAGRPDRFDDLLSRVRTHHGRKRNLMAMLARKGW